MRDWKQLVQERLSRLNLPPGTKQEVIAELAAHLEESAVAEPRDSESANPALPDIQWQQLMHAIENTKRERGAMNRRTKTLWLPAMSILFAAGLVLMFLQRADFLQRLIWIGCMALLICTVVSETNHLSQRARALWLPAIVNLTLMGALFVILDHFNFDEPGIATPGNLAKAFRIPWLLPLPVLGAVGALLARRAQASRAERLIAGLAPSLVWLTTLAALALIFAVDRRDFSGVSHTRSRTLGYRSGDSSWACAADGCVALPTELGACCGTARLG